MKIGMDIQLKNKSRSTRNRRTRRDFHDSTVAQRVLAAAMEAPVTVMETAGRAVMGASHSAAFYEKSVEETLTVFYPEFSKERKE